jgi:DMSO/TMAO reductase YedYZ heme-binding membrane subunit
MHRFPDQNFGRIHYEWKTWKHVEAVVAYLNILSITCLERLRKSREALKSPRRGLGK